MISAVTASPRPVPSGFICNEGMKDILSLLMRHTTSVIFNTDADAGICRGEIYNNLSAWLIDGFTGILIRLNMT